MKNSAKKNHCRSCVCAALFSVMVSFLSSCASDDNEPKDVTLPDVSFTNLTENQGVWNTVPISLSVNDDVGIAAVDVFVDGSLITSFVDGPYETSWDSNTASDGAHSIKAVVTDESGNKTEKQLDIVVKNVLVKIDIASDQLYNENGVVNRGFIFLSDEAGQVIAFTEYANGQHIELKSANFNGETFYLTDVSMDNMNQMPSTSLATFGGIARGEKWAVWSNNGPYAAITSRQHNVSYAGSADLEFSGAIHGSTYEFSTSGSQGTVNETNPIYKADLVKNPGKLYVVRKDNSTTAPVNYGLYSNIEVAKMNDIDLSLVNKDLKQVTITIPNAVSQIQGFVDVLGYPDASSYDEPYTIGTFYSTGYNIDVSYPFEEFPAYYIRSDYAGDNIDYRRGSLNDFSHFIPQHTQSFSFQSDKLTYSASGNFDLIGAIYYTSTQDGNWTMMLPLGSNLTIPLLQVPEQLQDAGAAIPVLSTTPQAYRIFEFDGISDYLGVKTFINNSTHSINELEGDNKIFVDVTLVNETAGSRIKNIVSRRHGGNLQVAQNR